MAINQWWVVSQQVAAGRGSQTTFVVQMAPTKPANFAAGPFGSRKEAQTWIVQQANTPIKSGVSQAAGGVVSGLFGGGLSSAGGVIQGWLASLGGMIASGIETGFVTSLKDLWSVIVGPVEVILGFLVLGFVLVVYFKDDITALASAVGGVGLAVAA